MFTGIISELGVVRSILPGDGTIRLSVFAPVTCRDAAIGDSIAVNGVCLTATSLSDDVFSVEVVAESLDRSSLGALTPGSTVNLERPMPASGRFDGHIVQGHVDGVGIVASRVSEGDALRMRVGVTAELAAYVVEKGSIAVDGTSLTVTAVSNPADDEHWFELVLIPHTLIATVLSDRQPGDSVNLEVDILAKYVERLMRSNK